MRTMEGVVVDRPVWVMMLEGMMADRHVWVMVLEGIVADWHVWESSVYRKKQWCLVDLVEKRYLEIETSGEEHREGNG